jgi:hypothetical protein
MVIYVPVELDDSFTPGDSISISSTIDYLVCQEYCVPESIDLTHEFVVQEFNPVNQVKSDTLEFPMILNDASYTSIDTKPTAVINGTEVEIIVCGNDSLTKRWSEESVELSMLDATHYTFFPDNNCTQPADLITQGDVESDTLTITFDRQYEEDPATPARLSGRLLVKQSNGWVREYDIDFTEPQSQEIQP